jgi:2'-5' RNA ligase
VTSGSVAGGRGGTRTETGLLLALPELAAFTARWRASSHAPGHRGLSIERRFPPHLTLLTPWLDPRDPEALVRARAVAVRHVPMTLTFTEVRTFDDGRVVWLVPEPDDSVRSLLRDVLATFPECLPYRGAHQPVVPHLTVSADAGPQVLDEVRSAITRHGPLTARADRISAYARDRDDVWREVSSVPLG